MPEVIEAVVSLSINEWQDRRSVQCEIRQVQAYMPAKAFLQECQRQEGEIDRALLETLSRRDGATADGVERMKLEEAKHVLSDELLTVYQGTLVCVHTLPALKMANIHLAILHAQLDYALGELSDERMFNTLVMAPDWAQIQCRPRAIVMLDGFMNGAERGVVLAQFPQARIIEVSGLEQQSAAAAQRLLPPDDALRTLYRALRQREAMENTLSSLAAQTSMTESMALCGLYIFKELALIEFATAPFRYRLLPSGKVSLEASAVRARLLELAEARGG